MLLAAFLTPFGTDFRDFFRPLGRDFRDFFSPLGRDFRDFFTPLSVDNDGHLRSHATAVTGLFPV